MNLNRTKYLYDLYIGRKIDRTLDLKGGKRGENNQVRQVKISTAPKVALKGIERPALLGAITDVMQQGIDLGGLDIGVIGAITL